MPANQQYHGLNISWGLGATSVSITNVTGLYQSADHELKLDEAEIKDQRGTVQAWVGYNPNENLTLEYIANDTQSAAGNAVISYPTQGSMVGIASDVPMSGSGWIVQGATIKRTNTDAAKVSLKCIRYPNVTT